MTRDPNHCEVCKAVWEEQQARKKPFRTCTLCKRVLPATLEFFQKLGEGLQRRCKECTQTLRAQYFQQNKEKVRLNKRAYYWANTEKVKAWGRGYREQHPEAGKAWKTKYHAANPEKIQAQNIIHHAIKNGTMIKPTQCERCHEPKTKALLHGHHQDYQKPRDVLWLCAKCHWAIHQESGVEE
jgi:RNase P subunit RPR2